VKKTILPVLVAAVLFALSFTPLAVADNWDKKPLSPSMLSPSIKTWKFPARFCLRVLTSLSCFAPTRIVPLFKSGPLTNESLSPL